MTHFNKVKLNRKTKITSSMVKNKVIQLIYMPPLDYILQKINLSCILLEHNMLSYLSMMNKTTAFGIINNYVCCL